MMMQSVPATLGAPGSDLAELVFADSQLAMSVRSFVVREGLDRTFEVLVTAGTRDAELDLDRVAGHAIALRLLQVDGAAPRRSWSGICREIEQLRVEETGLSIYVLRIVPSVWRLTQRVARRIFQHQSALDVAKVLLAEWGIEPEVRLQGAALPKHEYRVQLEESDFSFLTRQLEEAGISYWFEQGPPPREGDTRIETTRLVLGVEPQRARARHAELPVRTPAEHGDSKPYVRDVRVGRSVRAGRYTLRGHEFRSSPELQLLVDAQAQHELERRYELYRYAPGAFLAETGEGGGVGGVLDAKQAAVAAQHGLERERTGRVVVRFDTNLLDLEPGCVVSIAGHPRAELCHPGGLLVTYAEVRGDLDGEWHVAVEATPTREPYRARLATPKPRAHGLESAVVVGPGGEDVHTDEFGRVKVHFHWDREGRLDDRASCWLRVSHAWAGQGHGMVQVPRVGSEVLVGFFEGDPDQPLVVGRAFNRVASHPYPLPQSRTRTVLRSRSTPGGDGYNELSFEDRAGEEVVHLRAQRDLERVTLHDERVSVGANLSTSVRGDERLHVGGNQSVEVRGSLDRRVGGRVTETFERGVESRSGARTGITMEDGKIVITNGQASIVLDGPIVRIDAASNVWVRSNRLVTVSSKQVNLDKSVSIEQHEQVPADVAQLAPAAPAAAPPPPPDAAVAAAKLPAPEAPKFDAYKYYEELLAKAGIKVKLPKNLPVPPEINQQLEHYALVAHKAEVVKGELLDPATYQAMKDRVTARLEAEKARLQGIGDAVRSTFEKSRDHLGELRTKLGDRYALEADNLAKLRGDLGDIFSGKRGNFIESVKALVAVCKEQAAHVQALRRDVVALIEEEKKWLEGTVGEAKAIAADVKGFLDGMKQLVDDPKDAVLDLVLGPDKQLAKDVTALADELGFGKEAAEFFGLDAPGASAGGGAANVSVIAASSQKFGSVGVAKGSQIPALGKLLGPQASVLPGPGKSGALLSGAEGMGGASSLGGASALGGASGAGGASALGGVPSMGPGAGGAGSGGAVVARAGGLGANDLTAAVGPGRLGFVQSPADGQRMVVATDRAVALDPARVSSHLVDAQLAGKAPGKAMSELLQASGYAVYERPWGDYAGPFVEAAAEAGG